MASGGLTTVVVVDDHPAIVSGLEAWCAAADPPVHVLDSGATPAVAWTDPGLAADVIVFDLHLSGQVPAYADLRRLVDAGRRVVVYTMREDRDTILVCLDLGAFAYLAKTEGPDHLVHAIRAAGRDQPYTPPAMARAISTDTRPERPRLTPRETDVLVNWFACESKEMVGRKLGLSVRTVNSYIDRVRIRYANAGRPAPTKAALVARAIQDGLVRLDEL
ncbi:response regulator transcription factor [Actinosynnema sp. NPDC047251]|uniref:Two-component system, response regulator of the LuxR family n=1 Tax=Saccharothrix espanaensis (strain ATCC 51144 / DSM 44229 / JCM 9112 / NBRC 15066 / NRRL 15764) TaxID=1179773 RepID=K0K2T6_SACES|nr:response regulator transcription factor [Saccharothrix espanaensis]CCH31174.1 Two-component system, response regulator of the LuxR family [Saccharothrix espanaensis DSM 44229]